MPPRTKNKTTVVPVAPIEVEVEVKPEAEATPEAKAKETKPRVKKSVKVVAVVTPYGIDGSFATEPRRPLIAHLQVVRNDVVFNQEEPEPFDSYNGAFVSGQEQVVDAPQTVEPAIATANMSAPLPCFARSNLMMQFKDSSEKKHLPDTTDIACFWCVHSFTTKPVVIPEREIAGVYKVYGNFCCPQCAMAHLLSENIDPHVRWERMALLQRLYDRSGTMRIFPAPARDSLKVFGGPMTIESFRATVSEGRVRVDLHMPPMVSILGSIDTKPIDFFDTSMKNTITAPPIEKKDEGLRLKRTKPLKDRDSTLDSVLNIQIGSR